MAFTQNSKIRQTARVRVTKRIESKPDHRGRRQLLAREGEEISAREALRRGIPEKHLEGVGPGADVTKAALKDAAKAKEDQERDELLANLDAEVRAAAAEQTRESDEERSARARAERTGGLNPGAEPDKEFPHHRGGGHYELSDGSVVQGKDDAEKAEAALHDDENAGKG